MSPDQPSQARAGALSERDVSYLKLLKTLKVAHAAGGGSSDLGVVQRIADWIDSVPVLNFVCLHRPWIDDWGVKEALLHNDLTPARHRVELEKQVAIFDLLRELDDPQLTEQDEGEIREDLRYLFKTLPEHDRAIVKQRADALSRSRDPDAPAPSEAVPVPPAPEPSQSQQLLVEELSAAVPEADAAAAPDGSVTDVLHVADREALITGELELDAAAAELEELAPPAAPTSLATATPEQLLALARGGADADQLTALAHDPSEEIQLALLANPALTDRQAAILARKCGQRAAGELYRSHRRLFMRPLVQRALLECPNAPSSALLEIVNGISDLPGLMKLIRNPKIRFLEVKAKARHRLATIFRSLGPSEKLAALRRAGRGIIKELWTDFFRDENLVLRCVKEGQVDTGTILEIARSKIAPRRALEAIGTSARYTANYQVCLELVLNPKTPRQVVTRLMRKLNPADRKMVKGNPSIPVSIRNLA